MHNRTVQCNAAYCNLVQQTVIDSNEVIGLVTIQYYAMLHNLMRCYTNQGTPDTTLQDMALRYEHYNTAHYNTEHQYTALYHTEMYHNAM